MWGTTSQQQSLGMNCFNVPTWIDAKPLHSLPWGILWIAFLGSCPRKWLGDVEEKFVDDGIVAKRADDARSEPGPSGRGKLIVNLPTVMLGGPFFAVMQTVKESAGWWPQTTPNIVPAPVLTCQVLLSPERPWWLPKTMCVCVRVSHGESASKRQVCHLKSPSCKMQVPATPEHWSFNAS